MKAIFIFTFFLLGTKISVCSDVYHQADSITKAYMNKPGAKQGKNAWQNIVAGRFDRDLQLRIDTICYKYAFMEEIFNAADSTIHTVEYYFKVSTKTMYPNNFGDRDTLPDMMFIDGQLTDQRYIYYSSSTSGVVFQGKYEYYYTLDAIRTRCSSMLPVQELTYDDSPPITNYIQGDGRLQVDTSLATKKMSEEKYLQTLKSSYKIITFLDKTTDKVMVSLQWPAKNPKLTSYNRAFEYHQW